MAKRPKSDGRCIHCLKQMQKHTKDHVFPSSWYPDSTPPNVQRWTVPSCGRCNKEFGAMEEILLVRFGLCVDPRKQAASGLAEKVKRAFGIGVAGLSETEKRIRKALMAEVLGKARPYDKGVEAAVVPGFGLHAEFPSELQLRIDIPANAVQLVAKKILRGCEYWLAGGRIIEPPYELEVFMLPEAPDELLRHMPFGPDYLGPGCRIRRAVPIDEPNSAIYEIVIWETWKLFFSILTPDEQPVGRAGSLGR